MRVLCSMRRAVRDSVTWRCLHGLLWVLNNLEIQCYNTSTTDRHRRQRLKGPTGHRRLRANVSCVCRWVSEVYLANVGGRRRHQALAAKVTGWHVQTMVTVSDINSPAGAQHQTTDAVRRRRQWTETCSSAELHGPTSRRGVTNWNIYRQSPQHSTEAVSGQWSQHRRRGAASVHRFTSTITWPPYTRRCWLSRQHICSGQRQLSYFAARRSLDATSSYHRRTSAERQEVPNQSVLQRAVRTTAGCVLRGRRVSVWCCWLAQLHIMQFVLLQRSTVSRRSITDSKIYTI